MLVAVLVALVIGTFIAVGPSFSRPTRGEAFAAAANERTPDDVRVGPAKDRYVPMTRRTASLLIYSVLQSGKR